jgi:hypothetical protein
MKYNLPMNNTSDISVDSPTPTLVDQDDQDESNSDFVQDDGVQARWTIVMVVGLIFFLLLPFLTSKRRRNLWWRRIRGCRWVEDTDRNDGWYVEAHRRRQERRRQLEDEQQKFRMSRTQEDEIREHFLLEKMEIYTITLSESAIFNESDWKEKRVNKKTFAPDELEPTKNEEVQSSNASLGDDSLTLPNDVETPGLFEIVGDIDVFEFRDTDGFVCIPLPGKDSTTEKVRSVPNGCNICLGSFMAEEKIAWSSNSDCSHTFHHECLIHWFLTVGRKTQSKWYRQNPNMSEKDALDKLCQFPMLCPCCRQPYYPKNEGDSERNE